MLCHVDWQVVTKISKAHGANIFRVKQSKKSGLLDLGNENTTIPQTVGNCLPVCPMYHPRKLSSVLSSNLTILR
jgi:hypothetical protein